MTISALNQSSVTINATGTLQITGGSDNAVNTLTINGGQLDLTNTHLFIDYGAGPDPIASIAAWIASGYAGGSGMAQASCPPPPRPIPNYGIGYADSADTGNPANLSSGTIEIKYTLLGDANLDGVVNAIDFGILAANFNKGVTGWDKGDFNYDNVVSAVDFGELAANFNKGASGASIGPSALSDPALVAFAQANGLMADVPEPAQDFGAEYTMSGGSLAVTTLSFYDCLEGGLSQTGGTVTVGSPSSQGSIVLGSYDLAVTYSMSGNSTLALYGNMTLEFPTDSFDVGSNQEEAFTQSGGNANIYGNILLGGATDGYTDGTNTAELSFSGSANCNITGSVYVGGSATEAVGTGTFSSPEVPSPSGGPLLSGTPVEAAPPSPAERSLWDIWTPTASIEFHLDRRHAATDRSAAWTSTPPPATATPALGNSLTLGSGQSLIVDNYEWLSGSDATVSQGSGSSNSCTALYLGNTDVSTTYDLNAGATLTTTLDAGYQYVGYEGGDGSTDAFQQSGGVNSSNDLYIGYSDSAIGVYTQTAGSNTVAGNIYLAYSGQTLGTYSLSGGSVTAQNVYVGGTNANFAGGKGTLNISGSGQMTVSDTLMIYGNGNGSSMSISGGSLDVVGNTVNEGSITQTGGTSQLGAVTGFGNISLGLPQERRPA
jgi:hypothetical protein